MGLNAVTSVPKYTDGEILEASRLNVTNSGIPVFADATARDAGFGGTGEKVLAEGQYAYLESTNATQYYDGAAWQTVGGGLTLIKTQTVGNAVSSVQVTDAFSTTYDNYRITYQNGTSSAICRLNMTLGAATTGYYWAANIADYTNAGTGAYNGNNTSSWAVGYSDTADTIIVTDVISPFLTRKTWFSAQWFREPSSSNIGRPLGNIDSTTSYTSFTITPSTGTITGGTIRVYGYQNS